MNTRLNSPENIEAAKSQIRDLLNSHAEWFCTFNGGTTESLNRSELEIEIANGRLFLTCWSEKGTRPWRIFSWELVGEKLLFQTTRRLGSQRPLIELVPRSAASEIAFTVKSAREVRCDMLAHVACSMQPGSRVERCSLSPGARLMSRQLSSPKVSGLSRATTPPASDLGGVPPLAASMS